MISDTRTTAPTTKLPEIVKDAITTVNHENESKGSVLPVITRKGADDDEVVIAKLISTEAELIVSTDKSLDTSSTVFKEDIDDTSKYNQSKDSTIDQDLESLQNLLQEVNLREISYFLPHKTCSLQHSTIHRSP